MSQIKKWNDWKCGVACSSHIDNKVIWIRRTSFIYDTEESAVEFSKYITQRKPRTTYDNELV